MALGQDLAIFPNSRIKPRATTKTEVPFQRTACGNGEAPGIIMPDGGVVTANGNILLMPADPNRTFLFFRNTDQLNTLYFCYVDSARALTAQGTGSDYWQPLFPNEGTDIESKEPVYVKSGAPLAAGRIVVSGREGEG